MSPLKTLNGIILFFLGTINFLNAQTIKAVVADEKSKEAIADVFVFLDNSSTGTISNEQGVFELAVTDSKSTLVFSHLNYELFSVPLKDTVALPDTFFLTANGINLEEVIVVEKSNPKNRARWLKRFTKDILGASYDKNLIKINNPSALLFKNKKGRLTAEARAPLIIDNGVLGYQIKYFLESYESRRNGTLNFFGKVFFEAQEGSESIKDKFEKNRYQLYQRSSRSFFVDLIHSDSIDQNYELEYITFNKGLASEFVFNIETGEQEDITANQLDIQQIEEETYEVSLNQVLKITNKQFKNKDFISYLSPRQGRILMNKNGAILNPTEIEKAGYWSRLRLASLLPSDYKVNDKAYANFVRKALFGHSVNNKLQQYQAAYPLEKIYISHNQPHYAPGDTLYGKIFLVDGRNHQVFVGNPIIYVDWLSEEGTILASNLVKIKEGVANLSLPINREYGTGKFLLRAYTQYQRNFEADFLFQKEIKVIGETPIVPKEDNLVDRNTFSLQFFPEGGHLVVGLNSKIAFKAVNDKGEPINVIGKVVTRNKEVVSQFKTINEGIGLINLIPQEGEVYQAEVQWKGQKKNFKLPKPLPEGYVLSMNNREKEKLRINLSTTIKAGLADCTLIGHVRGQPFLNQFFTAENAHTFILDKTKIPSGVLHFTLFDNQKRPVSERLVFNNNPREEVRVKIDLPQKVYGTKELVKGTIMGQLAEDTVKGNMTLSVYNKALFPSDSYGVNIKSHLLLQGDLKGRINNINQYFEQNDTKSRTLLDFVMLTHGWRRFSWPNLLEATFYPLVFAAEEGVSFAGKVTKNNKQKTPIKADVFLSILDEKQFYTANMTTEADGLFDFKGFDLSESTEVLIQGNIYDSKKKKPLKTGQTKLAGNKRVKIEQLYPAKIKFKKAITLRSLPYKKEEQVVFSTEVNRIRKIDTIYHPEWSINLDAVMVKALRIEEKEKRKETTKQLYKERGLFYSDASQKIYGEDLTAGGAIYTDIFEIIRNSVGRAEIVTTSNGKEVILLNTSISLPVYAKYELNGALISANTASAIPPSDILLIDVKKSLVSSSIYGEAGSGGIISIITKEQNQSTNTRKAYTPNILAIQHAGYHKARTFYTPDYATATADKEKPDYRTTLYWNGESSLSERPTTFEFYTGDKLSDFLIFVEGITNEGLPFIGQQVIRVGK